MQKKQAIVLICVVPPEMNTALSKQSLRKLQAFGAGNLA